MTLWSIISPRGAGILMVADAKTGEVGSEIVGTGSDSIALHFHCFHLLLGFKLKVEAMGTVAYVYGDREWSYGVTVTLARVAENVASTFVRIVHRQIPRKRIPERGQKGSLLRLDANKSNKCLSTSSLTAWHGFPFSVWRKREGMWGRMWQEPRSAGLIIAVVK